MYLGGNSLISFYVTRSPTIFGVIAMIITLIFHLISTQKEILFVAEKATEGDKRVSLENELIQGIRVVKLFGWENRYVQVFFTEICLKFQGGIENTSP